LSFDVAEEIGTAPTFDVTGALVVGRRLGNIAASTAPLANGLYPKNVSKCCGKIVTLGDNTQTFDVAAMDGFNFTATWISNTKVRVAFVLAMTDTKYNVTVGNMGASVGVPKVSTAGTGSFDLELYDMAGVAIDLRAAVEVIAFDVHGR
jgi:hypothetical protein